VERTDRLLGAALIDPSGLIGDLNLRAGQSWVRSVAGSAARAVRAFGAPALTESGRSPVLLALDWTGTQTELLIGRSERCDVVLEHWSVSRRHTGLRFRDGHWIVHDLHSTNGTEVNGCRIGRCQLRPGDELTLGGQPLTID
jgi:hypothetical protein